MFILSLNEPVLEFTKSTLKIGIVSNQKSRFSFSIKDTLYFSARCNSEQPNKEEMKSLADKKFIDEKYEDAAYYYSKAGEEKF